MESTKRHSSAVSTLALVPNTDGTKCGLCGIYPGFLRRCATPRAFLVCFCLKNVLQGMIFTYLVGIETSLERHFQFDGKTVGLLLTLGEIGPILTAVWISHLGSSGNRPRWMASGLLLIALALALCYSMNLMFPPPELEAHQESGAVYSLEAAANKTLCAKSTGGGGNGMSPSHRDHRRQCTIDPVRRNWAFAVWVLIYSIMGIGGTTVYVIGAPYLDDSISKNDSPFYFSITMAVRIVGPVFGYLLSSMCLKLYVDLNRVPGWESDDPRWIGAWWLGAIIMAFTIFAFALVVGAFPRKMPKTAVSSEEEQPPASAGRAALEVADENTEVSERMQRIADFKAAIVRLLRNPVLLCSCGSSVFTILGLAGYFVWLPKYFEHEFRISKSQSAMYSGLSGNASMIIGVLLSGYFMTRYRPAARKVSALVATTKYAYAVGLLLVMLANCGFNSDLPGELNEDGSLNLNKGCNEECHCTTEGFSPVCLRGSTSAVTYFSPCHAGCTEFTAVNNSASYHSCKCNPAATITTGFCSPTCSNMYVYMGLLAIIKLVVSFSAVGNLIIDLRCVEQRDKALALGLLAAVSGLLGFLPNPVIYGALIDSSCLIWEKSCGQTGSCWVYDTDAFRYKLHGLTSSCLMVAGMFEVVTYFKVKNLELFKNTD